MVFFCEFLLEASSEKAGNGSRDSFFAPAVADAFNDSVNAELNLVVRSGQSNKGCNTLLTHADANTVFAVSAVACMELCDVRSRSTAVQKLNGFHAEKKDFSVEALPLLDSSAAAPYIATLHSSHGRHSKDGNRNSQRQEDVKT